MTPKSTYLPLLAGLALAASCVGTLRTSAGSAPRPPIRPSGAPALRVSVSPARATVNSGAAVGLTVQVAGTNASAVALRTEAGPGGNPAASAFQNLRRTGTNRFQGAFRAPANTTGRLVALVLTARVTPAGGSPQEVRSTSVLQVRPAPVPRPGPTPRPGPAPGRNPNQPPPPPGI